MRTETVTDADTGSQRTLLRGLARWSFLILVGIVVGISIVSKMARLPTNATGNFFRGVEDIEKGNYEAAIASLTRAIQLDRNDAEAYKSRAYAKTLLGDPKSALSDYEIAVHLTPFDAEAYEGRGYARQKLGDHAGAIADYDRAITFDPSSAEAYMGRGSAYETIGDPDRALEDFTRALQIDPENGKGYLKRANLHFDEGRWDEAIFGLRQGFQRVDRAPVRDGARLLLWAARARHGDGTGANAELTEYLRSRPDGEDGAWLRTLGGFLTGQATEEDVLRSSGAAEARQAAERRCEALFYAAEKRLVEHDEPGALDRLRRSRDAGAPDYYAASRAAAEIRGLQTGFRAMALDKARREELSLGDAPYLLVSAVREGGPAARDGLLAGDVILTIGGSPATLEALSEVERSGEPGTTVELGVARGGRRLRVSLTLGARPAASAPTR